MKVEERKQRVAARATVGPSRLRMGNIERPRQYGLGPEITRGREEAACAICRSGGSTDDIEHNADIGNSIVI